MIELGNFSKRFCPDCGGMEVRDVETTHIWTAKVSPPAVTEALAEQLSAVIPVLTCNICGFQCTDYRTEDITFVKYKDWLFEKTGILIDTAGNRVN